MIENDHVTVQDLRGFAGDSLRDAFEEAHAISRATRCKQFLFSLSFNPPKDAVASLEDLLEAVERAEKVLGLDGQPRALVIHEKNGRRHLHAVWSRIDAETMKAINLPFYKTRLNELSRELFLDHGWELPDGFKDRYWKNPLNFTLAEWQQAKRIGLDPREIKQVFRQAWERSDDLKSFGAALEEHGYYLAKGDRRGHVAVDLKGEVFTVARYAGVKTKEVNARLGSPDKLDSVSQVAARNKERLSSKALRFLAESKTQQARELVPILKEHRRLVLEQREKRETLKTTQELRRVAENAERQSRFRRGLQGIFDILTGRASKQRKANEQELKVCIERDQEELEAMYLSQLRSRSKLQTEIEALRLAHRAQNVQITKLIGEIGGPLSMLPQPEQSMEILRMGDNRRDFARAASRTERAKDMLKAASDQKKADQRTVIIGVLAHTPRGTGFFPVRDHQERKRQAPVVDRARMDAIQRKKAEWNEKTRLEPNRDFKVEFKRDMTKNR
ncbi:MAG: relaxase/mobilization nuclease domain-containing protein [Hyphomicrobiaceae bacterium]|nr:relaxase/mobilization nuclease domain-containing protein [Hyphomicrobiaceae bacterium]